MINITALQDPPPEAILVVVVCLFVSYLFRVGHSTDMYSLLQENLLGGKKESVSRSYIYFSHLWS